MMTKWGRYGKKGMKPLRYKASVGKTICSGKTWWSLIVGKEGETMKQTSNKSAGS